MAKIFSLENDFSTMLIETILCFSIFLKVVLLSEILAMVIETCNGISYSAQKTAEHLIIRYSL